jgi:hypothetical protein
LQIEVLFVVRGPAAIESPVHIFVIDASALVGRDPHSDHRDAAIASMNRRRMACTPRQRQLEYIVACSVNRRPHEKILEAPTEMLQRNLQSICGNREGSLTYMLVCANPRRTPYFEDANALECTLRNGKPQA